MVNRRVVGGGSQPFIPRRCSWRGVFFRDSFCVRFGTPARDTDVMPRPPILYIVPRGTYTPLHTLVPVNEFSECEGEKEPKQAHRRIIRRVTKAGRTRMSVSLFIIGFATSHYECSRLLWLQLGVR